MKNKNVLRTGFSILLGVASVGNLAWGQADHSHGGEVVRNGAFYSLVDFSESGIEKQPWIQPNIKVSEEVTQILIGLFPNDVQLPKMAQFRLQLGKKLGELSQAYPLVSDMMLKSMQMYGWEFVNSKLVPIADAHLTIEGQVFQIANRQGARIQINKTFFNRLGVKHQVGLVFHEILYALSSSSESSDLVRALNGYLFKAEISTLPSITLFRFVKFARLPEEIFKLNSGWVRAEIEDKEDGEAGWEKVTRIKIGRGYEFCSIQDFLTEKCDVSRICETLRRSIEDKEAIDIQIDLELFASIKSEGYASANNYSRRNTILGNTIYHPFNCEEIVKRLLNTTAERYRRTRSPIPIAESLK